MSCLFAGTTISLDAVFDFDIARNHKQKASFLSLWTDVSFEK